MKKPMVVALVLVLFFGCQKPNDALETAANETFYVQNKGASMRVNVRGNIASKAVMLVVHGGPGGASYFYRTEAAAEKLEKKYAAAYWDQRVAGASQGSSNKAELRMEQFGDDLKKVIQTLRFKYGDDVQVFLMGQSWGGMVCAQFMTDGDNQSLVSGWISANALHNWPLNDVLSRQKLLDFGQNQIALGKNVENWQPIVDYCTTITGPITPEIAAQLNAFSYEALELIDGFTPFDEDEVIRENLISEKIPFTSAFLNLVNPATQDLINSLQTIEFSSKLSKVTKPVLALSGAYDFVVPEGNAIDLVEKVSSTVKERRVFLNTGHNLEEQEGYVDAFIKFIDENR